MLLFSLSVSVCLCWCPPLSRLMYLSFRVCTILPANCFRTGSCRTPGKCLYTGMRMIMSNAAPMQDFQLNVSARFICPSGVVLLRAGHSCARCGARAGATDFPGDLPVVGRRGQHRHIPVCGLCHGASPFHMTLLSTYLGVVAGVSRPQVAWHATCCRVLRAPLL